MGGKSDSDFSEDETRELVRQQFRKKRKSGGFQSMGLPHPVFNAIMRKGYKVPSPIQRKSIPVILEGKDVVAMARTGSGKTAAFLIPMFVKLKVHTGQIGARALILSPTRELALQTLKFTKELGRFTGLKAAVILGGDNMSEQFNALHSCPDIIIATPGRFMHVVVEMDLKLDAIEYVVFDEADRLFEMGFETQLREIIHRLSDKRQTCLFSATLPKLLVDFARAGLHDPTLIRLDVDNKISPNLRMSFFQCRTADKDALLIHMLTHVIKSDQQTLVFLATKHHVEYANTLLTQSGIACCCVYSSLDSSARKINVAKFENRRCRVMLVTDIAARGIDIPILDNVINFHFPAKSKLFVHRVGRVARAGKSGCAYSFVAPDEMPYLIDLHMFLGRSQKFAAPDKTDLNEDCLIGNVPHLLIDNFDSEIKLLRTTCSDLTSLDKSCGNAIKLYLRSRPAPSKESIQRYKELSSVNIGYHPLLRINDDAEAARTNMLASMKNFRPRSTVFEMTGANSNVAVMMQHKRAKHTNAILAAEEERKELNEKFNKEQIKSFSKPAETTEVSEEFNTFKVGQSNSASSRKRKLQPESVKDEENYVSYRPSDHQSERGLSVTAGFDHHARAAILDLTADENDQMTKGNRSLKWDRKKKKFVGDAGNQGNNKKIQTESGQWISASYRSDVYRKWLKQNNMEDLDVQDSNDEQEKEPAKPKRKKYSDSDRVEVLGHKQYRHYNNPKNDKQKLTGKKFKTEIKTKEQIVKSREKKENKQWLNQPRAVRNKNKGAGRGRAGSSGRGRAGSSGRGRGGASSQRGGKRGRR